MSAPGIEKVGGPLVEDSARRPKLTSVETMVGIQFYTRLEPELRLRIVGRRVDVGRFDAVVAGKSESDSSFNEDCRHGEPTLHGGK